jgi:hypothetical protein
MQVWNTQVLISRSSDKSKYCFATEHSFDPYAALIQRQLLSNIEQS